MPDFRQGSSGASASGGTQRRRGTDEGAGLAWGQRAWPTLLSRVVLVLLALSVLVFAASVFLREPGGENAWLDLGLFNVPSLLAALLLGLRAWTGGRAQRPWAWLAVGLLVVTGGGIAWSVDEIAGLPQTQVPIPDVFYLAFYPLALMVLGQFTKARLSRTQRHQRLDGIVVGTGVFALSLHLLTPELTEHLGSAEAGVMLVNAFYIFGDLVLLAVVLSATQAFGWRPPATWWLLGIALVVFAVTDTVYLLQASSETYVEGSLVDVGWPLSALAFGLAAYLDRGVSTPHRPSGAGQVVAPAVMIIAAALVLNAVQEGPLGWIVNSMALATIVLGVIRMYLTVRDSHILTEELRLARIDPLTGLPNRRGLDITPARDLAGNGLVVFALDGLDEVTDSLGGDSADRVVKAMADRIQATTRSDDAIARSADGEFVVIVRRAETTAAVRVAESVIEAIEEPLLLDGISLHVSACAGVTAVGDRNATITQLMQEAHGALAQARQDGPGLVRAANGSSGENSQERLRMRADIRAAFRDGGRGFAVHYQPIVSIATGQVLAAEALVRWHCDGKILSPGAFLDDVIRSGSMKDLTEHMLATSMRELRAAGLDYPVTVNVPPDMIDGQLLSRARAAVDGSGSTNEQLVIEITEDAIMRNPAEAATVLRELRSKGFGVLLDDFGTGWSGLSSLRDLVVDGLKMDASFVSRVATDETSATIVRAISNVAQELGVYVIYEGTEDPETLPQFDCFADGYLQGYAIARPMPIEDLVAWSGSGVRAEVATVAVATAGLTAPGSTARC